MNYSRQIYLPTEEIPSHEEIEAVANEHDGTEDTQQRLITNYSNSNFRIYETDQNGPRKSATSCPLDFVQSKLRTLVVKNMAVINMAVIDMAVIDIQI